MSKENNNDQQRFLKNFLCCAEGNSMYGSLNSFQVFLEAGGMYDKFGFASSYKMIAIVVLCFLVI